MEVVPPVEPRPFLPPRESRGEAEHADCCIVGGGPAGVVLSYLLARAGVRVTLLEAHDDFDRDFRGDTMHPATLELLDQMGLADRLLALPHVKAPFFSLRTRQQAIRLADFRRLDTKFPYIAFLPQHEFLDFMAREARRYKGFRLHLGARADALIEDGGVVRGVRYRKEGGHREVRAQLTVGADGRASMLRRLAGFEPRKTSPPMDILWFVLPRRPEESEEEILGLRVGAGVLLVVFGRPGAWQVGYVMLKGTVREVRAAGLEALRESVAGLAPEFADRLRTVEDWRQVRFLSVESSLLERWSKPGLLLIGDAAHVMSPVGGVGINYAIQDAVATANALVAPLREGRVTPEHLEAIQKRRGAPTRFIQRFQRLIQNQLVKRALDPAKPFTLPLPIRVLTQVPILRNIPAHIIGFGIRRERLDRTFVNGPTS